MRVFEFHHAIVREPGLSVVSGLRSDPSVTPRYEEVRREHAAYVAALRDAGLAVDVLPPLEAFPDSVFVEDPAFVLPEGAVVLRPGAPTRLGEAAEIRGALHRHFKTVLELSGDEYADGGDVLVTPQVVMIGLSRRTNRKGAEALRTMLKTFDREEPVLSRRWTMSFTSRRHARCSTKRQCLRRARRPRAVRSGNIAWSSRLRARKLQPTPFG
jgi:dimethylargininase